MSHIIWKDIVKNNNKRCLILEDACIFTEDFYKLNIDIPENWEILYLRHFQKINSTNTKKHNKIKKLIKGVNKTHIYDVSLESAHISY